MSAFPVHSVTLFLRIVFLLSAITVSRVDWRNKTDRPARRYKHLADIPVL